MSRTTRTIFFFALCAAESIYLYIRFRWSDLSLHTFQMELVDILGAEFSADPSIKNKLGELAEGT